MRLRTGRKLLLPALLAGMLAAALPRLLRAAENAPSVTVDASHAQPRQVEETTVAALQRDYGLAWRTMSRALEENRPELLNAAFVGIARDKLRQAVSDQARSGLRRRYIDHGHRVQVVFYSADGSAIEMHDTASIEIQLLDGNKVVHREQATLYYVALMSPAETSWKVRALQSVPAF